MIIDTHAHITCDALYARKEEVIEQAKAAGVGKILVVCTNAAEGERALRLADTDDMFDVAIGFHPCDLYDVGESDWQRLEAMLALPQVVAVGEIGLDYHWKDVDKDTQKRGFIRQIEMANAIGKPVSIHMREATRDTLDILKKHLRVSGVMHCFNGSEETVREILDMGMYISVGGPLTFKNARGLPEVIKSVPLDRLFVETDCPYLTPHPHRGKQNEPKYVVHTLAKLCELKETTAAQAEAQMLENYQRLFHNGCASS